MEAQDSQGCSWPGLASQIIKLQPKSKSKETSLRSIPIPSWQPWELTALPTGSSPKTQTSASSFLGPC
jgi:hypothetical protein